MANKQLKLTRWANKNDYTLYCSGKKVFRGSAEACDLFTEGWYSTSSDVETELNIFITDKSKNLFIAYAEDAQNWGGTPLVGGNVGGSREDRGNLTQLKKAGLIETFVDDEWVGIRFTELGKKYAAALKIEL